MGYTVPPTQAGGQVGRTPPNPRLERLLGAVRDALSSGDEARTVGLLALLAGERGLMSHAQAIDLLERSCVYGPEPMVELVWRAFGPFTYRGWALALALRCAHEDIARFLIGQGVDLLEDEEDPDRVEALTGRGMPPSRFDLTRTSPNLLLNPFERSVSSEVFSPFAGNEELVGGSFSTRTDVAATCELVGRLAGEGAFDSVAFDDLLRAAIARASEALDDGRRRDGEVVGACLRLAGQLVRLWHERGMGSRYASLVLGSFVRPKAHREVLVFVCENAPEVFLERLASTTWLQESPELVKEMVPHLRCGDAARVAPLVAFLARNGFMTELEEVASWPGALSLASVDAAMAAAAEAGRAEPAAWLLSQHKRLADEGAQAAGTQGAGVRTLGQRAGGGQAAGTARRHGPADDPTDDRHGDDRAASGTESATTGSLDDLLL